jgi:integrase/recombinase XerD
VSVIGVCRRLLSSSGSTAFTAASGWSAASSHSGRRSFITRAARKISEVGGSLRDIQQLAGHASLGTTSRYIEADHDAQRKVVALI